MQKSSWHNFLSQVQIWMMWLFLDLNISWKLLIMGIKVIWLKNELWSAFWFQKQNYKNVVSTSQPNKQTIILIKKTERYKRNKKFCDTKAKLYGTYAYYHFSSFER